MADIIFNRTTGELKAFGKTWSAVSGGGAYKPLSAKKYTIPALSLMVGTEQAKGAILDDKKYNKDYPDPNKNPFRDTGGLAWYLWLGSAGLGIHPDGNVPGTEGCIGVKGDTRDLFDELRQHSNQSRTLEVVD